LTFGAPRLRVGFGALDGLVRLRVSFHLLRASRARRILFFSHFRLFFPQPYTNNESMMADIE
jgi:hypothetical protein